MLCFGVGGFVGGDRVGWRAGVLKLYHPGLPHRLRENFSEREGIIGPGSRTVAGHRLAFTGTTSTGLVALSTGNGMGLVGGRGGSAPGREVRGLMGL